MKIFFNIFMLPVSLIVYLLYLSFSKELWSAELSILKAGVFDMTISILLEKENVIFIFTVAVIFTLVYQYTFNYMSEEIYIERFILILSLFASSMCILIMGGNLFTSLIGWDGLGVTSFFLILFYYSKSARKASSLTFLMNRVGDCFFILALVQAFLLNETQSCSIYSFPESCAILLILTSITKSAQIPFSTWLPAAMEAPTPVSALVHSSTLVTAGIYLLFRYNEIWSNSEWKFMLMIVSIGTCYMACLAALVESDLKKLIALSTLSQLGFIMFSLSLNLMVQGFMHMIMHAYFKALLFMCAGFIIHSVKGSQSIYNMSISAKQNPMLVAIMSCSLLAMSGLPFLSGFYSKDAIIDSLKETSWPVMIYLLLVLSFIFTNLYSVRILWYLLNSSSNWHSNPGGDMIKPMIPLATLAFSGGAVMSWVMMDVETYVDSSKTMILMSLLLSLITYWKFSVIKTSYFLESKWGLSIFNPMVTNLSLSCTSFYSNSSDLSGFPEIVNMSIKMSLKSAAKYISHSMTPYTGAQEFFVFLVILLLMTI